MVIFRNLIMIFPGLNVCLCVYSGAWGWQIIWNSELGVFVKFRGGKKGHHFFKHFFCPSFSSLLDWWVLFFRLPKLFSMPYVFSLCVILGWFCCYVFKFLVFPSAISILLLILPMCFPYQILYFSSLEVVFGSFL